MRYHLTAVRMTVVERQAINPGEDVEEREPWCTVCGNMKWHSHYGKQYFRFLKKLKGELAYEPTMPLLDRHPKEIKSLSRSNICTLVFSAVLFTTAKSWKQPK